MEPAHQSPGHIARCCAECVSNNDNRTARPAHLGFPIDVQRAPVDPDNLGRPIMDHSRISRGPDPIEIENAIEAIQSGCFSADNMWRWSYISSRRKRVPAISGTPRHSCRHYYIRTGHNSRDPPELHRRCWV